MRISEFDYDLPEALIAQKPVEPRDHSRLLVFDRASGRITDDYFYNLPNYLPENTTLVVNNSKVEKARLLFGNREIFITQQHNDRQVTAMVRPGRKFKAGTMVTLTPEIQVTVTEVCEDGQRRLTFNCPLDDKAFEAHRHTPFPPYIASDEKLAERYQTVYAKPEGSKAAPTAGLHFTDQVFAKLSEKGIYPAEVTLHVGLGTFAPVKSEEISGHNMHSERYIVDQKTAEILQRATHITAVGTTSARVLETLGQHKPFRAGSGDTDIFITPGYTFTSVNALITNFHLPKSTLLMLLAAFMGMEEMKTCYQHAIKEQYRFYSFGDAMLIL